MAALGLFSRSIGAALTGVGLWGMTLMSSVLMLRDGSLLARARPLDRWETRSLTWLLVGSAVAGVGVFVDAVLAAHSQPATSVVAAALSVAVIGGAIAVVAMLRR